MKESCLTDPPEVFHSDFLNHNDFRKFSDGPEVLQREYPIEGDPLAQQPLVELGFDKIPAWSLFGSLRSNFLRLWLCQPCGARCLN